MFDSCLDCYSRTLTGYSKGQTIIYHVYTSVIEVVLAENEPIIFISIYESFAKIYSFCSDVVKHPLLNLPLEDPSL